MEPDKTITTEFEIILVWLLDGAKQWAKACGHVEPLPGISTEATHCYCDKD